MSQYAAICRNSHNMPHDLKASGIEHIVHVVEFAYEVRNDW